MSPTKLNPKQLTAAGVLGGEDELHAIPSTDFEWIALVRQGISASAIDAATRVIGITQLELAKALDISPRTVVRRKRERVLSRDESEKLVRLANVFVRAAEVFEGAQCALDWLKAPNAALCAASPLSLLDTELGANVVLKALGRIEQGVF